MSAVRSDRPPRSRVVAHVLWELRDLWRRVSAHPLTTLLLVLGLPAILAAYALFGHLVSQLLLDAWVQGHEEFAVEVTRAARIFAVLLVLMGSGGVIGNLFHGRPREMLARYWMSSQGFLASRWEINEKIDVALRQACIEMAAPRLAVVQCGETVASPE